jgi:hypothetical protein
MLTLAADSVRLTGLVWPRQLRTGLQADLQSQSYINTMTSCPRIELSLNKSASFAYPFYCKQQQRKFALI